MNAISAPINGAAQTYSRITGGPWVKRVQCSAVVLVCVITIRGWWWAGGNKRRAGVPLERKNLKGPAVAMETVSSHKETPNAYRHTHTHTHTHTASLYTYIWMGIYISPFGHIIIIIKKNRRRQGRSADGTRLVLDGSLRLSLSPSFLPFPHFPLDVWVSKGLAFFRPRLQSNEIAIINPLRQVSWPWSVAARRFASDTRVGKIPTSKTQ